MVRGMDRFIVLKSTEKAPTRVPSLFSPTHPPTPIDKIRKLWYNTYLRGLYICTPRVVCAFWGTPSMAMLVFCYLEE